MLFPRRKWKDIKGYEGLYQVSNLGEVKSLNYKGTGKEKILIPYTTKKGYKRIGLCKGGKQKQKQIHRLVAIAFIPNINNYPQVNHIDENKANNCAWNLEWCDNKYNANYGHRNNNIKENHGRIRKVICINTGKIFNSAKEAAYFINQINGGHIIDCCKGKRKTTGKDPITKEPLKWRYYDKE